MCRSLYSIMKKLTERSDSIERGTRNTLSNVSSNLLFNYISKFLEKFELKITEADHSLQKLFIRLFNQHVQLNIGIKSTRNLLGSLPKYRALLSIENKSIKKPLVPQSNRANK